MPGGGSYGLFTLIGIPGVSELVAKTHVQFTDSRHYFFGVCLQVVNRTVMDQDHGGFDPDA